MVLYDLHVWPRIMRGMAFVIVMQFKRQLSLKLFGMFYEKLDQRKVCINRCNMFIYSGSFIQQNFPSKKIYLRMTVFPHKSYIEKKLCVFLVQPCDNIHQLLLIYIIFSKAMTIDASAVITGWYNYSTSDGGKQDRKRCRNLHNNNFEKISTHLVYTKVYL